MTGPSANGAVHAAHPVSHPDARAEDFAAGAVRDITVIGAGPVGLATAFWAGMREASSRVVDSLPEIGGQLTTLYPEKWIFDVPGHPKVLARELVDQLRAQALEQFDVPVHLETTAETISWEPDPEDPEHQLVVLHTDRGELRSRTVIVAGGHGAFEPKLLLGYDMAPWEGKGAHYLVTEKAAFAGKRVVIVGGGDSAMDWVINLLEIAERITLVHRRDGFTAHDVTVGQVKEAAARGEVDLRIPYQVREVTGDGTIERVTLFHTESRDDASHDVQVDCDAVLLQLGFKTALGPLKDWGFEISKGAIVVDGATMATSLGSVWACGDIATHGSKLKLIATGFGESAIAVAQAVQSIRPEMKLQPKYSTNTGVPGAIEGQI